MYFFCLYLGGVILIKLLFIQAVEMVQKHASLF
jgi:hypothetical protein